MRANMIFNQKQEAEQRQQQRLAAMSGIQNYFKGVDDVTSQLLPQDAARFQQELQPIKKQVIDQIKQFGNDPDAFIMAGGQVLLDDFIGAAQKLPSLKKAQVNLANYNAALKDLADPEKHLRIVSYTLPDGTTKQGTIADNLEDFNNGWTDTINYSGSFKTPMFDALDFDKVKRNGEQVGSDEFVNYVAQKNGLDYQDAAQWLGSQGAMYLDPADPSKTVFRWGAKDPYDEMYKQLRLKRMQNMAQQDQSALNSFYLFRDHGGANGMLQPDFRDQVAWQGQPKDVERYLIPPDRLGIYLGSAGITKNRVKGTDVYSHDGLPTTMYTLDGNPVNVPEYGINHVDPSIWVIRDPKDPTKNIQALRVNANINARDSEGIMTSSGNPLMGTLFAHEKEIPGAQKDADWNFWNNLVHPFGGSESNPKQGFNIDVYVPLEANDAYQNYYNNKVKSTSKGLEDLMLENDAAGWLDEYYGSMNAPSGE